ncbi:protein kinase, partial [Oryctes borbonicus]
MEVFNKIYSHVSSSVSSTVSQLSGVLPGNPVTREFDASCHIASAGPGLLWKIYKGMKRSTKQEASIFVFEKRQLDKWNKADRDIILDTLKRGVTQLTKIRHPQVLTVQHPIEESRESLAFATEPVFASLANVLGHTFNMPQPTNLTDYKLFDIEIKYGLLQLSEGLAFLHNDVKLLHKNICPESIIINQQGAWKIFGFDFCILSTSLGSTSPSYPFEDYSPTLPNVSQPNLGFLAPECVLSRSQGSSSDLFSLGMLIYAVHGKSGDSMHHVKDLQQFKSRANQLKQLPASKLQNIPDGLKEHVKMLLNVS